MHTANHWVFRLVMIVTATAVLGALATLAGADCPREGEGGDPELNTLKNRTDTPSSAVAMTVDEIAKFRTSGTSAPRRHWSAEQRRKISALEGAGIRVTGYLVGVKREGTEATNCHDDAARDLHVWLADEPNADHRHAMIVEITPRVHAEGWTQAELERLAKTHRRVRVTGWLLYDHEHPAEVGKSRATMWELHPVTQLEVFTDGVWRIL